MLLHRIAYSISWVVLWLSFLFWGGIFCFLSPVHASPPDISLIVEHYADVSHAVYEDSLLSAIALDKAIAHFVSVPTPASLTAAREAWKEARIFYEQTEVFRFGNPVVDAWEPRVNAWPMDEGLIDYVNQSSVISSQTNLFWNANVISNETLKIGGRIIDAREISPEFLSKTLHEIGGLEVNVASGYHAIEFLLWGQDLSPESAGKRPASDFDTNNCTGGHCDRRIAYLKSASALLLTDLREMVTNWSSTGVARQSLLQDSVVGIRSILTGIGALSYGELAGERMKLGLLLHAPEEEHDCFSDETPASHYYSVLGIRNVYQGHYVRRDGLIIDGPSLSRLIRSFAPGVDAALHVALDKTLEAMENIRKRALLTEHYDQMILEGNIEGNAVIQVAIDRLIEQSQIIEEIDILLVKKFELPYSDSLDSPDRVFQ
ncbi:MAG: imelysin family protein [Alphaproteobacteria bacterium]|nr:imelysin family protein [Alphaproteobacteria bacterium]